MTARWSLKSWMVLASTGLMLVLGVGFAVEGRDIQPAALAILPPACGSCAARHQHGTRLAAAKDIGVSP